jgi:hypothetical protein
MGTANTTEIEGLLPWIESGALPLILKHIAIWYEGTDEETNLTLTLKPWRVSSGRDGRPDLHLKPALEVALAYGRQGYRGTGSVIVWRTANPDEVVPAIEKCLTACKEANAIRKREGSLTCVVPETIELG